VRYPCDTSIVSEVMRRSPRPEVVAWFESLDHIALSAITVEEIHCGLAHRDAHRQLDWFEGFCEAHCEVLSVTDIIAAHAGSLRGQLRRAGQVRTQADMLIAATASSHRLTLATRTVTDFDHCGIALLNPFPA